MLIELHPPARLPADAPLVRERAQELATIDDVLTAAQSGIGAALVIEGEAGIGKSTLVRHAASDAARRGLRVLKAQGGELERELPYGIVVELFGAAVRDPGTARELFSGPARLAAPLFGMAVDPTERPDPVAYLHGLVWLVLNLAEEGPLVIVVDDGHWADDASLRFLQHLVNRVEELPLVVMLALRPGENEPSGAAALVRSNPAATVLALDPLSEVAVGELIAEVAGGEISDDTRHAAWRATGGNPFLVTELAADLVRAAAPGGPATDLRAAGDADPAGIGVAPPPRVGRYVESRLATAAPEARRLAEAVAVLGESATLYRAARLASLAASAASDAARWLVEAAIVHDGPALEFRHPLVRSAVDAAIPGPVKAELHRRAGLLLADDGVEIGVVGTQLREAAPAGDPAVVELLRSAAAAAMARGDAAVAVTLLRRALQEPPGAPALPDVLVALARAEAAAALPVAAETFAEALALTADPDRRAALQLELGHALLAGGQWAAARDTFERAIEGRGNSGERDAAADDLQGRLEAAYLSAAWVTMEDREGIEERVRRILDADRLGDANRELAAWIAFQQGAVIGSTAQEMGALVRRVFSEVPIEELVWQGQTVEVGAGLLLETDDLSFEVEILSAALEAARRSGPIGKAGIYAYCRAWPSYYMGRLTDAIADGEEALRAGELGWEAFVPGAATATALAHIERDDLVGAERVIAIDQERWAGRIDTALLIPLAAGRLALAGGDVAGAIDHLQRARDAAGASFMRNPVPTDWRTWYATALLRQDRRVEARAVAGEGVEIARAWGARWPLAGALRVAGIVEGGPDGIRLLREGLELLHDSAARLEHVRLLVSLGATLRRNGSLRDARTTLAKAVDDAHRIGARALLRRATDELRAAGARPRRLAVTGVDALTPGEIRVAQEAAGGRTNREIAQELFVTPKAVEFHLANTYRKLGIGSRTELAAALGASVPAG